MPLSDSDQDYAKSKADSLLDISTATFYFSSLRPHMMDMLATCRTDHELLRTIEKVINSLDSLCVRELYTDMPDAFHVLEVAITDRSYFNTGVMLKAKEEEKDKIKALIKLLSDFKMIIQCEPRVEHPSPKTRDRLNYKAPTDVSPNGENLDYPTRNIKTLTEPHPKNRIPNTSIY